MKIYLVHSSKYDFRNELYKPLQDSRLNKQHKITYLFDETVKPGSTKDIIKNSDLVIAEVSHNSLACGIEIGWANAFDIPLIFIHKTEFEPSQYLSLLSNTILEYANSEELVTKFSTALEQYSHD